MGSARGPTRIAFGTSGWRGIIGDEVTFTNVRALARAIAEHIAGAGRSADGVIVGYDTRFLSAGFAAEAARTLAGAGVRALLCDRETPTPVVAHEIIRRGAAGGIIITASHNPPQYNGLKFSSATGGPALPEVTGVIAARANALLAAPEVPVRGMAELIGRGLIERIDPGPPYCARLRELVNFPAIAAGGVRMAVDLFHGAARGYLDALLGEAGCTVTVLRERRDPSFGGQPPDPSEESLGDLAFEVLDGGLHLGLAVDGDGDRFGVIDADGTFLEPNYILALLLRYLLKARTWPGGVGRTVATTHLLDAVAKVHGLPVYETPVGFKYLGDLIVQGKLLLGGEESAGMSVRGHIPEKDGILACLLVAEMVAESGRSRLRALLQELYGEVGTLVNKRVNLAVTPADRQRLMDRMRQVPETFAGRRIVEVKRVDGVKWLLEDGGWVLLRPSGTEPVVRFYAEATSERDLSELIEAGRHMIFGPDVAGTGP